MTPKDIITLAANKLNIELTDENTSVLLRCCQFVLDELALDYFPLTDEVDVRVEGDGIFYKDLPKGPVRILDVGWRKNTSYRLEPDRIVLKDAVPGSYVRIKYTYSPKDKGLNDEIEYPDFMRDTLIFGVCSEYCAMEGSFEPAYTFSKYYRQGIRDNHKLYEAMRRTIQRRVLNKEEV